LKQNLKQNRRFYIITLLIYIDMILYGFINSSRSIAYPLIKNEFGVSYDRQGLMVSAIAVFSVIACIVAGIMLGRLGFRKSLMLGFAFILSGMFCFRLANGFLFAAAMFLLIQMGLGFFEIGLNGMGVSAFTAKSALMMSLLHFFYGIGAIIGPAYAGLMTGSMGRNWRYIYFFGLFPALLLGIFTFIAAPGKPTQSLLKKNGHEEDDSPPAKRLSFFSALKEPVVWLFGITMGFGSTVEVGTTNWSALYLQDVYGFDPKIQGALFVSIFYILYTASRFLSGFIIEKIGYLKSITGGCVIVCLIFAAGFLLGERGIWILPVSGFFIAILYPTMLALSIPVFRENAQTVSSVIIPIAFTTNGLLQYSIGLINRFIGAEWGYRSSLVFSVLTFFLLLAVRKKVKAINPRSYL
jgi:fucose permease